MTDEHTIGDDTIRAQLGELRAEWLKEAHDTAKWLEQDRRDTQKQENSHV